MLRVLGLMTFYGAATAWALPGFVAELRELHPETAVSCASCHDRSDGKKPEAGTVTEDGRRNYRELLENSPYLESLKSKNQEVLLLHDAVDEFAMGGLPEYKGKKLKAVDRGTVGEAEVPAEKKAAFQPLLVLRRGEVGIARGAGFGFFQSPTLKALLASAPPERSGGASGIVATSRLIGQTTGAALVALCFGIAGRHGSTLALGVGALFAGAASIASSLRLFAPDHRAQRPAS